MPKIHAFYSALGAFLAVAMVSAWPMSALAQLEQLELLIKKGDVEGRFVVNGDVTYDLGTGTVAFSVLGGEQSQGSDNPLFCFDFSNQAHTVKLNINGSSSVASGNTLVLADKLGLTSALQYQLANQTIAITPSSDVACFFNVLDTQTETPQKVFGLYGTEPAAMSDPVKGVIFQDDFSATPELDVSVSESGSDNGGVQYQIKLKNNSNFKVERIALQQSVPYGVDVSFTACKVNGQDSTICETTKQGPLRFFGFGLDAGATLVVSVTAFRNSNWPDDTTELPIYVATATPALGRMIFDVAESNVAPPAP